MAEIARNINTIMDDEDSAGADGGDPQDAGTQKWGLAPVDSDDDKFTAHHKVQKQFISLQEMQIEAAKKEGLAIQNRASSSSSMPSTMPSPKTETKVESRPSSVPADPARQA